MLEHALWAPGHLTVRTLATRREHRVEVDRDGRPVAEGDGDGLLRALDGLVLAEAPLVPVGPDAAAPPRSPTPGRSPAAPRTPGPSLFVDAADDAARPVPGPPAPTAGPSAALRVEVFGHLQGWVHATTAVDRLRERALHAELVVDGVVLGRLTTLGGRGEEAVVRDHGGAELATLARFDHLRGLRVTTSSWDLHVHPVEDPRLRVLSLVSVLRLPALWSAAIGRDPRRARRPGHRDAGATGDGRRSA